MPAGPGSRAARRASGKSPLSLYFLVLINCTLLTRPGTTHRGVPAWPTHMCTHLHHDAQPL